MTRRRRRNRGWWGRVDGKGVWDLRVSEGIYVIWTHGNDDEGGG